MAESEGFVEEESEETDPEAFEEAKAKLRARCDAAGIKCEEEAIIEGPKSLGIHMPAGREEYRLLIVDTAEAEATLGISFEKYRMLGEYTGVCCYDEDTIEAGVRPVGTGSSLTLLQRRLFGKKEDAEEEKGRIDPIVLRHTTEEEPMTLILGKPSSDFMVFQDVCGWRSPLTLRVLRARTRTHDKTIRLLERLANSLFFQIDLNLAFPLNLERERRFRRVTRRGRTLGTKDDLKFPEREYDPQPMSLYWYAKSSAAMPLLQFLAYYQVLEFYMPTYSNHEAIGKIRNILKDPRFSPDKDPQLARILAALRLSARGFGDERSQLESVIRRCVSSGELRSFCCADNARRAFFENDYKKIVPQRIPLRDEASDLLAETAHRLYELRCRIVHTKDSSDRDLSPLLPYSKEAAELYFDIDLIEYVATSVLVASSTTMKLE